MATIVCDITLFGTLLQHKGPRSDSHMVLSYSNGFPLCIESCKC